MRIELHIADIALFLAFIHTTCRFLHTVHPSEVEKAAKLLQTNYQGIECPKNYTLYSLLIGGEYHELQVLQPPQGALTLHRCHVSPRPNPHLDPLGYVYQSVPSRQHQEVLNYACQERQYAGLRPERAEEELLGVYPEDTDPLPARYHNLYHHEETQAARTNTSIAAFISQGIYPGTKWCGVGNIAHDVYDNLGEHADTDACCRAHDLCRPVLESFKTRYHARNPTIYSMLHCGCDVALYNCFRRVDTPVSREVGRIFFNLVKMKCFDFDVKEVCTWTVLGYCLHTERRCGAVIRDNPRF